MDFRKSFSKPFKKLKDKLPGGSRKRDGRSVSEEDGRKGGDGDVRGNETNQGDAHLDSEVSAGRVVGSGPGREGSNIDGNKLAFVDADPLASTLSISRIGEPNSM